MTEFIFIVLDYRKCKTPRRRASCGLRARLTPRRRAFSFLGGAEIEEPQDAVFEAGYQESRENKKILLVLERISVRGRAG